MVEHASCVHRIDMLSPSSWQQQPLREPPTSRSGSLADLLRITRAERPGILRGALTPLTNVAKLLNEGIAQAIPHASGVIRAHNGTALHRLLAGYSGPGGTLCGSAPTVER
jgi:hypothetical protein